MTKDQELNRRLGEIFDGARGGSHDESDAETLEKARHDFVFHMTDWKEDLTNLVELFDDPGKFDDDAASRLVIGFLYHVIPHLNTAGRLLLDEVKDPFATAGTPSRIG